LKISRNDLCSETLALRRLPKDRYVSIYDYVSDKSVDACAYSMELLDAPWMTLSKYQGEYINAQFYEPEKSIEAVRIISLIGIDIIESLNILHGKLYGRKNRWVHADIKPNNIYIQHKAAKRALAEDASVLLPFTKIGDLGLTRRSGAIASGGTPIYRAPEQENNGTLSAATDMFAVGQTLAFMVLGTPFDLSTLEHVTRMRNQLAAFIPSGHLVEAYTKIIRGITLRTPTLRRTAHSTVQLLRNIMQSKEEWTALRALMRHKEVGLNLNDAADVLFPELKLSRNWRRANKERINIIKNLVKSMHRREILNLQGHRYIVRPSNA